MASLTHDQADILVAIIEEGEGRTVVVETGLSGVAVLHLTGGKNLEVNPSDIRELEAQGILRKATGDGYDVTNDGREVYQMLKQPPEERPPVGFQPS